MKAEIDRGKISNIEIKISLIVSVLHQDEGWIGKSIPDAQDFSRVEGNLERFPAVMGFAPRDPRDFPRAKPEGNPEGRGVQNP